MRPRWSSPGSRRRRRGRRPRSGSGATWRGCTRPGPRRSVPRGPGFIAGLPLRATDAGRTSVARLVRGRTRLLPYARRARDAGLLTADGCPADRDRGRPRRRAWPGRAEPPEPDPRRLLVRERAVVRRPGVADRPGGPRRAPGDRPGHAGPVRCAVPVPDRRLLRGGRAAGAGLAGPGAAAPAASAARARVPVRPGLPGRGAGRRPAPRWPWRPDSSAAPDPFWLKACRLFL